MTGTGAMMHKAEAAQECIEEFEKHRTEESAARLIVCLQSSEENIYWDDELRRLRCAAEEHDKSWTPLMEETTKALGIKNREAYIKIKKKYNLTQY